MNQPRIHLSLRVHDLERSVAFYTRLFAAPPDKRHPGYARFMPADIPVLLSLMPGDGGDGGRLDHLGIRLPDRAALDEASVRLKESATHIEEGTACCFSIQDKLWLTDPDGHSWEVYVVTDEQAPALRSENSTCCVGASCG